MAKPKRDPYEKDLLDLLATTRTLREEARSHNAMTAAVATLKREQDILLAVETYRRAKGATERADAEAILAELPRIIGSLPESAFATIAQAVDARRRTALKAV